MFLTAAEVALALAVPYWSRRFTESVVEYRLYQGHRRLRVHTLRFNVGRSEPAEAERLLMQHLSAHFEPDARLSAACQFDLLLRDAQRDEFYLWRANSNIRRAEGREDEVLRLNPAAIHAFYERARAVLPEDLNMYFTSSNVIVDRLLSRVFTFTPIS
jgi:hypothetical protein